METKHKEAKQGNFRYSGGRTGETGLSDYQKSVLNQQFCHEWATVGNRDKKGCSYSSDFKVQKRDCRIAHAPEEEKNGMNKQNINSLQIKINKSSHMLTTQNFF